MERRPRALSSLNAAMGSQSSISLRLLMGLSAGSLMTRAPVAGTPGASPYRASNPPLLVPRVPPHPEPVPRLFARHLLHSLGDLADAVQVLHRRQHTEQQSQRERHLFIERPPLSLARLQRA